MKRYYCMLLLFALCLIVAGCRRGGGGVPRRPVAVVNERDIIPAKNERERMFQVRPNDRKFKVWLENVYLADLEFKGKGESVRKKHWGDVVKDQEESEKSKDQNVQKFVQGKQAEAAAAEAEQEFKEFAQLAKKYLTLKQANPRDFNQEEFYKWMRREAFVFNRKHLDKVDLEIFHEEVRIFRYLETNAMIFVPDVDMDPRAKDYIIGHRDAAGGGGGMGGGMMGGGASGKLFYIMPQPNAKDPGVQSGASADVTNALKRQDLRLIRMYYLTFAATNFMRPPSTPEEIALWNFKDDDAVPRVFPLAPYDSYIKRIPYENPYFVYRPVADRVPTVMKNPGDPRDLSKFKAMLAEKAPPTVLGNLENGVVAINMQSWLWSGQAQAPDDFSDIPTDVLFDNVVLKNGGVYPVMKLAAPRVTNAIIACRTEVEEVEMKTGGKYPYQVAILADGRFQAVTANVVAPFRPVIVPKNNMGGMPGGMGGGPPPR